VHAHALDDLRGPARQALSVLAAKLPPAPTRVLVRDFGDRPAEGPQPADTLLVVLPLSEYEATEPDALLWIMVEGAGVPPCEKPLGPGSTTGRYLAARVAAAAWLLDRDLPPETGRGGEGPEVTLARQALATLRALPADEQRARVTALRDPERTCAEGDRFDLLTGTGGPR
jgi:hypothetical protein